MIKHFSILNVSESSLKEQLAKPEFAAAVDGAKSLLIQFYSAYTDERVNTDALDILAKYFPNAIIVGATTVGEIFEGACKTGQLIAGFTCFESTRLNVVSSQIDNNEYYVGHQLGRKMRDLFPATKGLLLLSTPLSIDAAMLLSGIEDTQPSFEIFGGGAGDYASMNNSLVYYGKELYSKGLIAVAFEGEELVIDSRTYLGWRSLSRPMRITQTNGMVVESIDNKPAFEVYRKYLGVKDDDNFFLNALEFPLLIERHDRLLARVPVAVTEAGGLVFVADIEDGEVCRLGYGDPGLIIEGAEHTLSKIEYFCPQVVYLYSCGCRRFLMQDDVDLETLPIEKIAPTFGFYTYGEFYSDKGKLPLLNSTLVSVAMKEGAGSDRPSAASNTNYRAIDTSDPYANKHARIVGRLVKFITAMTEELEQANQAKSQFLANTSHELRTPLTAITGYAEAILNGDIESSEQLNAVEIIHKQSKNLVSLINDILDISKIEARELDISITRCEIRTLLKELESIFSYQASEKGLQFLLQLSDEIPSCVRTDESRLRQILINLCGNAIKFTEHGSIILKVNYQSHSETLEFDVIDTGTGLTPEQIEVIFSPFAQVNSGLAGKPNGTGLGLSISRELAILLGGDISTTSSKGNGSDFKLTIKAERCDNEPQRLNTAPDNLELGLVRQINVLLAEDSVENGCLFKLFLEKAGFSVDLVENGAQALDKVMSKSYHLILLDIQMPVMGGLEALEFIQHCGIDTPVVALTANAMTSDVENYLSKGFVDCVAKPVTRGRLIEAVKSYTHANEPEDKFDFDPLLYKDLAEASRKRLKGEVKILNRFIASDDLNGLKKLANKIKGVAAQFGFDDVSKCSAELEVSESRPKMLSLTVQLIEKIENL